MQRSIGVIIPAHNAAKYLAQTLTSIASQTAVPAIVIVVDDGSNDETGEIASAFGATVIRQRQSGVSAARNAAMAVIDTDYVAFCDADDVWKPTKLERQHDALAASPECDFAFCDYYDFKGDRVLNESILRAVFDFTVSDHTSLSGGVYRCDRIKMNRATLERQFILPSTFFMRTELIRSMPGFCTKIGATDEDLEYLLRVFTRTDAIYIDEPLMGYRVHENNATRDPRKTRVGTLRLAAYVIANDKLYRAESAPHYRAMFPTYLFRAGRIYASFGHAKIAIWFLSRSLEMRFSIETLSWLLIAPLFKYNFTRHLLQRLREFGQA